MALRLTTGGIVTSYGGGFTAEQVKSKFEASNYHNPEKEYVAEYVDDSDEYVSGIYRWDIYELKPKE